MVPSFDPYKTGIVLRLFSDSEGCGTGIKPLAVTTALATEDEEEYYERIKEEKNKDVKITACGSPTTDMVGLRNATGYGYSTMLNVHDIKMAADCQIKDMLAIDLNSSSHSRFGILYLNRAEATKLHALLTGWLG